MKKCSKCGKVTIDDGYNYCTRCGTTFNNEFKEAVMAREEMGKEIYDWNELAALEPVPDWTLEVDTELGGAHLNHKISKHEGYYLTTHTFYNRVNANYATTRLRKAGYNVRIISEETLESRNATKSILDKKKK